MDAPLVDFNGELVSVDRTFLNHNNRGLRYGDALFETIRAVNGTLFFWEAHYLRLMASMRLLRMEIPMHFTMEGLEASLSNVLASNNLENRAARLRFTVFRNDGGRYLPASRDISYVIEAEPLASPFYQIDDGPYGVELFKDFYLNVDMLSTLKTNNRIINVMGSIFAQENGYENCLLMNTGKEVVEALNGNLFLVQGNIIKTPPLRTGCINGILRKKLMEIIDKLEKYELVEDPISPFELQKADELFITNTIVGIRPITKYRKKDFERHVALDLLGKLNAVVRLEPK